MSNLNRLQIGIRDNGKQKLVVVRIGSRTVLLTSEEARLTAQSLMTAAFKTADIKDIETDGRRII